ncbi:MAG: diacylglycerol kinase family lipid kinase [Alphaproteobacteria bacterium]|nr:diacylglycerol kinase family lipid kinase [Alphaproteobacteria bacterium]
MSTFAVVNPRSAGGRTAKAMGEIGAALKAALGDVIVGSTQRQGDATRLVAKALDQGYRRIVAIGGDGTLNEAVNGMFRDGAPIAPDAAFSFAMSGSGGDFKRSLGIEHELLPAIAALKDAAPRKIDLGRVTFIGDDGTPDTRLFLNIASFGLPGEIVNRVNRAGLAKRFGGPFAFRWHSTAAALTFRPWRVHLAVDDGFSQDISVSTVAICNGRYFGGGMKIAPEADIADGLFDIVVIAETGRRAMIARMNDIYSGAHVNHPNVKVLRGRKVTASPLNGPCFAERDGEGGMNLPATFEILPGALTLVI